MLLICFFLQNLVWLNIAGFGTLKEVESHNEVQNVVHAIMPTELNLPLKVTSCSKQIGWRPIFGCIFWEPTDSCSFLIKAFIEIRCCLGLLDVFICVYLGNSNKISYNSINYYFFLPLRNCNVNTKINNGKTTKKQCKWKYGKSKTDLCNNYLNGKTGFFHCLLFFFSCYGELVRTLYLLYNVQIYGLDPLVR